MRIIFMGTPDFSVPTLKSLVEAGHEVAAVVDVGADEEEIAEEA